MLNFEKYRPQETESSKCVRYGTIDLASPELQVEVGAALRTTRKKENDTNGFPTSRFILVIFIASLFTGMVAASSIAHLGNSQDRFPIEGADYGGGSNFGDAPSPSPTFHDLAKCSPAEIAKAILIGSAVALVAIPLILIAIGLAPWGPIAGSWFAANMGAGLTTGGIMALMQSLAAGGSATAAYIIAATSAAAGGGSGAYLITILKCQPK